ncbi:hypothetical protein BVY01_01765 [bacterium I07]|nr:hypothetical protein BVY01_01765 [bacterium I07]
MMKIKIEIILGCLLILGLSLQPCVAQIEYHEVDWGIHPMEMNNVGTAGWQFLHYPTNARSAAMGGIITALGYGNAASAMTNPASTADVESFDLAFSHMDWVADIGFQTVAAVKNLGSWGVIGVNFVYVDYGEMVRTENLETFDILGNSLGILPVFDDLGTFTASDMAIGLSYSRQITNKLQVGGNLRYLEERLDDAVTHNWALDIGTLYYTGIKTFRISMLGKSFGPDADFASFDERIGVQPVHVKMPMLFALGGAMEILEGQNGSPHRLTLAAEYTHPNDGSDKVNLGTEYALMDMFFLRAGYRFNYDVEGMTFGAGLNYGMGGINLKINYAYLDVGLFNQLHMFTVGMSF